VPLTPADVANKQFKITFRGYSLDEVDSFLDEVEGELGRLLRENNDIKSGHPAAPVFQAPAPAPVVAPPAAPLAPGEGQEAALRTLLLAQRTADEVVAEARAEAGKLVADAQGRADNVDNEIAARINAALGGLEQRKRELEVQIEDLRAFEREYRTRLKAYLEGQLRDLSARGAPDDGGAGVPAAARTAAVGLGPAAGAPVPPPPAPPVPAHATAAPAAAPAAAPMAAPTAAPPAAPMAAPMAAPPSYRPTEPPLSPPISPAPARAVPPPVPAAAPASTPPPAAPPAAPPREAEAPTLRAVPPLHSSSGPEPIGPFTIVPPSTFSEQLDDGPEPPAEQ
jgi:DivIVA domain-containing protein